VNPDAATIVQLVEIDVANEESRHKFVHWIKEKNIKIDILFNNAGVLIPDATPNGPHDNFQTNVFGLIHLTDALIPHLNKNAKIIHYSSMLGKLGIFDQTTPLFQRLNNHFITHKQILELAHEYLHHFKEGKAKEHGWPDG